MRITLSNNEVQLLRKVCYKFNIDEAINEEMDNARDYGYLKMTETQEEFSMTISERPIIAALETLNKLAPKVMQVIGAMRGVWTLIESLFNKDFMKELNSLTDCLTYKVYQSHKVDDKIVLEIDDRGVITTIIERDVVVLERALEELMKEYSSKKDLQNTVIGKNIANSVYELEKVLEEIKQEQAAEGGRS